MSTGAEQIAKTVCRADDGAASVLDLLAFYDDTPADKLAAKALRKSTAAAFDFSTAGAAVLWDPPRYEDIPARDRVGARCVQGLLAHANALGLILDACRDLTQSVETMQQAAIYLAGRVEDLERETADLRRRLAALEGGQDPAQDPEELDPLDELDRLMLQHKQEAALRPKRQTTRRKDRKQ